MFYCYGKDVKDLKISFFGFCKRTMLGVMLK